MICLTSICDANNIFKPFTKGITKPDQTMTVTDWTSILIGIVSATLLTIVVLFVVAVRTCHVRAAKAYDPTSSKGSSVADEGEESPVMSHKETLSSTYSRHQSPLSEDKNPDLIPLTNGKIILYFNGAH